MEATIVGTFKTRRSAELAVERVVQKFGTPRRDVFIQLEGEVNSARTRPSGADAKAAPATEGKILEGAIEVLVNLHGADTGKIADALMSAGASAVRAD